MPTASSTIAEEVRERYLREHLNDLLRDEFPDNTDVKWIIHQFSHRGDRTHVEVEPKPDTVGYPRFKIVVSFADPANPKVLGEYCLEKGRYTLLATAPGVELPNTPED